jgi:hypothetical protein
MGEVVYLHLGADSVGSSLATAVVMIVGAVISSAFIAAAYWRHDI